MWIHAHANVHVHVHADAMQPSAGAWCTLLVVCNKALALAPAQETGQAPAQVVCIK